MCIDTDMLPSNFPYKSPDNCHALLKYVSSVANCTREYIRSSLNLLFMFNLIQRVLIIRNLNLNEIKIMNLNAIYLQRCTRIRVVPCKNDDWCINKLVPRLFNLFMLNSHKHGSCTLHQYQNTNK